MVRKWPKNKSVWDIQVVLGFANFYWQFIQGFSRKAALLISILKTTNKSASSKNNGGKSAFSRNDNSKPTFEKNNGNGEVDGFIGGMECAKKSGKLKGQKTPKFQKLAKFKKQSKSGN